MILSATARIISFGRRIGGQIPVTDPNGQLIGKVDLVRGFAHYHGIGAHAGFTAVIRDGLPGLEKALADGVQNGRDDRN